MLRCRLRLRNGQGLAIDWRRRRVDRRGPGGDVQYPQRDMQVPKLERPVPQTATVSPLPFSLLPCLRVDGHGEDGMEGFGGSKGAGRATRLEEQSGPGQQVQRTIRAQEQASGSADLMLCGSEQEGVEFVSLLDSIGR